MPGIPDPYAQRSVNILLRLRAEQKKRWQDYGKKIDQDVSLANLIRRAVEYYIENDVGNKKGEELWRY